jgi:hypothetical protein
MHDDNEIGGTGEDRKSRALIEELEAANLAGGDVFPQTKAEIRAWETHRARRRFFDEDLPVSLRRVDPNSYRQ